MLRIGKKKLFEWYDMNSQRNDLMIGIILEMYCIFSQIANKVRVNNL